MISIVRFWLGSARNRGHKACFERSADIVNSILFESTGGRSIQAAITSKKYQMKMLKEHSWCSMIFFFKFFVNLLIIVKQLPC
ncbi:hypothetical protein DFO56_106312 [Kosakonia sp. AG348]|nr:hypothetical protein DFO56_106312 [Kosakonia sp. AG348]